MSVLRIKQIHALQIGHSSTGTSTQPDSNCPRLSVTVVRTTIEGTLAALQTAAGLATSLGARIALVSTQVIPFQFPLEKPPVPVAFLTKQLHALVCDSGIQGEEVIVQLWLCRDRNESLRKILGPRSLVVIGGKKRWWSRRERRLERFLTGLGHQVIFADVETSTRNEPRSASRSDSVLHPMLKRMDARGGTQ